MPELPEKKQRLLDAGVELMLAKGYNATAVDEVCSCAGVTKGSFFYYFKSKEDLASQLIGHYDAMRKGRLAEIMGVPPEDPRDRVYVFLDAAQEMVACAAADGCPCCLVGTLAQEIHVDRPELRDECCSRFEAEIERFAGDLAAAKAAHAPKASFDPKGWADLFLALIQGSMLIGKARQDSSIVINNLAHFRAQLEAVLPPA